MERLSVCEEEVYLEICWMSEPLLNRVFKGDSQRMQSCLIAATNKYGKNG